jgi:pimeloyl-ACP methyl ester carboxylesterase
VSDGQYIDVNGLKTYYEVHGEGEPLLLMHGGFCTVETFARQTPDFAAKYQVIVPERRGHGRTPDVEGPITYEAMAQDTIGLMQALDLPVADIVGYSDGGNTALVMALERPDIVRKMVCLGANFHYNGMAPVAVQVMEHATPDSFYPWLINKYKEVSPDGPDHLPIVFEKIMRMWREEPALTPQHLGRIQAPTLIIVGDRDWVAMDHTVEMYESIPNAQLCVIPGATHGAPFEKAPLVNQIVLDFLGS